MKINSIIVDDEKNSREVLQKLLNKFCPDVEIIGEADDVEAAYQIIGSQKPDLVFLDIQMPSGNGFTLLKKFKKIPFSVIFVTSYDQYAINAIKVSAIDYLLKPIEVSDLKLAVSKAISKKADVERYVINLLDNIDENNSDKKIPLHTHGNVRFIASSSILFVEADGAYTTIHNAEGENFSSSKSLKDFEEFFASNPCFVRLNKSILLNIKYIKKYSKGYPFIITMSSGSTFESSRRKKSEVLEKLKNLL